MVATDLVEGVRCGRCWSCFSWGFSTPRVMRDGGPLPGLDPRSVHASFLRQSLVSAPDLVSFAPHQGQGHYRWGSVDALDQGRMYSPAPSIIRFSAASKHMAVAPERATMIRFESVMSERGTDFDTMLARQPWTKPFNYELLDAFIQHQLVEKQDVTSFWRPQS